MENVRTENVYVVYRVDTGETLQRPQKHVISSIASLPFMCRMFDVMLFPLYRKEVLEERHNSCTKYLI